MASAEEDRSATLDVQLSRVEAGSSTHRLAAVDDFEAEGLRGSADGTGLRVAVLCSRFNGRVTGLLLAGALAELERLGVASADRTVAWVPGAFELPLAAMAMARTRRYDAVVCLGAVIRGETSHYDFVAGECASGLQRVQLDLALPVIFGVLTTENLEQALERAGGVLGNKGTEAAATAIEMATVLRQLAGAAGDLSPATAAGKTTPSPAGSVS
jgi:6,7-dimethyl-8-ribityllumazine synthase